MPSALALEEILRRLDRPIDAEKIRASLRPVRIISAEDLADKLRKWRHGHDLTMQMAAEALSIHARTVCAWEACTQYPQPPLLKRVLPLLDGPPVGVRNVNGWRVRRRAAREKAVAITGPRRWPFGRRLKTWRQSRGLNQLEAAMALGLPRDQALISSYEKGRYFPRPERLEIIEAIIAGEA
jgi:transcriptional regulator with XRE-family HTH domain